MWLGTRCRRRGAILFNCIVGLVTLLIAVGVEMDACRLFAARHKDQVIADAAVLAGARRLPYRDQAQADIDRVTGQYRSLYRADLVVQTQISPAGSSQPTDVRVVVTEQVPMFLPGLMGALRR